MKLKKKIELIITYLLAFFSPELAKRFIFRKAHNLNFSHFNSSHSGEVEILLLPYLLDKDAVFIDIGANRGLYCYYSEKIISKNNIIAFEPVPELSKLLKKLFPKIRVIEKALSNTTGKAVLNIPVHATDYLMDTRSTLEADSPELNAKFETITIETISLDDFIATEKVNAVTLLKIDVEGHEIKLISGAKKTLLEKRPVIIIEIEPINHLNGLGDAFSCISELKYMIYYFDLSSYKLQLAQDANKQLVIPKNLKFPIHNYVCFPIEKNGLVDEINRQTAIHK